MNEELRGLVDQIPANKVNYAAVLIRHVVDLLVSDTPGVVRVFSSAGSAPTRPAPINPYFREDSDGRVVGSPVPRPFHE